MTLTLTANIDAADRYLTVTGTVPDDIELTYQFRLGNELLELQAFVVKVREVGRAGTFTDRNEWYVLRGLDTTTAASHTAGDEVKGATDAYAAAESGTTPPSPFSSGGGGAGIPQGGPLTQDLDAAGFVIGGLEEPVVTSDAATKNYVDGRLLSDILDVSGGEAIADALAGASSPSSGNVFATVAQIPAAGIPQGGPLSTTLNLNTNTLSNAGFIDGPASGGTASRVSMSANDVTVTPGKDSSNSGGSFTVVARNGTSGGVGSDISLTAGNSAAGGGGAEFKIEGGDADGNNGRITLRSDGSGPHAGEAFVGTSDGRMVLGGIYAIAEGVPSGAPTGTLPIAVDTTAVTGGIYVWNGSSWVKAAAV